MADSPSATTLSDMPADELARYGTDLGLAVTAKTPRGELLRLIRERQALLRELDREAMLDIVVWARRPVRESAGEEELAREIAAIGKMRFDDLSDRGLHALARLRGIDVAADTPREQLIHALDRAEGLWRRIGRRGRGAVGSFVAKMFEDAGSRQREYRFLPESQSGQAIKHDFEEEGVVGGLARRLRGAADDYIAEKLDQIELRIDRKLDEIDSRLAEWRDREVANRLRIVKITLAASVLVAVLSLGYHLFVRYVTGPEAPARSAEVSPNTPPAPNGVPADPESNAPFHRNLE